MAEFEGTLDTPDHTGLSGTGVTTSLNAAAMGHRETQRSRHRERLAHIGPVRRLHPLYSPIVRFLKFILPVIALFLVVIVLTWPYIQKEDVQFTLGFATGPVDGSEDPTMVNPRYTGVDSDQQPFSVTADLAKNLV
ncbi:MAG: hypothetical protein HQ501_04160, partial [Rhodospirillales bacterium]|nr:hypothetical protein [Rhodospirillales bacterium]